MIIDLSSFLDGSENFFSFKGELEEIESDLKELGITTVGPIKYEGEAFRVDGENAMEIRIIFNYKDSCSRCLELSTNEIRTTLSGKLVEGREELEELDSEDPSDEEIYDEKLYYENDKINLKDSILNQMAISLPMRTLCNEDCKGLCSLCGIDLNKNTCDCVHEDIDPRFEQLKNFFPKN